MSLKRVPLLVACVPCQWSRTVSWDFCEILTGVSNLEAEVSSLDALRSSSSCLTPFATKLKSKILLWTVPMASVE